MRRLAFLMLLTAAACSTEDVVDSADTGAEVEEERLYECVCADYTFYEDECEAWAMHCGEDYSACRRQCEEDEAPCC